MCILSCTNPAGETKYIAASFPSACGKTAFATMVPTLPGYTTKLVGDDIAWLRFDKHGALRAINPEAGLFGVAPGMNSSSPAFVACERGNTMWVHRAIHPSPRSPRS
jgi:phosphoenolpyruvate carboxykinase (GTP)